MASGVVAGWPLRQTSHRACRHEARGERACGQRHGDHQAGHAWLMDRDIGA